MPTPGRTIADASPVYLRIAAIINGVLSLVGVGVSLYFYLEFPHPAVVKHPAPFTISDTESIESYIFTYPVMQILIFLFPAVQSLRWKTAQRRSLERELIQREKNPRLRRLDSVLVYNFSCALFVMFEVYALGLTIHSVLVAKGL